jgi:TonB family protein
MLQLFTSFMRTRAMRLLLWASLLAAPHLASAQGNLEEDLYGDAQLRSWIRPAYAAEWRSEKLEGTVKVRFIVNPNGTVRQARATASTDSRLEAAAVAAVEQWTFSPALEQGKPVASGMEVTVAFRMADEGKPLPISPTGEQKPRTLPVTPASERSAPDPEYPPEWLDRRIPALVEVQFVVDEEGRVVEPVVTGATHGGFVPAAMATLRKWKFRPALQGDLPVRSKQGARLEFSASEVSIERGLVLERLEPHGIRPRSVEAGRAPPWTVEPRLRRSADPVYPYALGVQGTAGEAEVEFVVDVAGAVSGVKVVSATAPEFGAALAAAVEQWAFVPARDGEGTVAAELAVKHIFSDPRGSLRADAELWRRVSDGEAIGTAKGLDRRLRPVYQVSPRYPEHLRESGDAGQAQLEFVIDREGVVRLVRVVSASHEAFGYAAAVALSLWCFDPPTRNGEPTEVRVAIPFTFAPPAQKS